MNYLYDKDYANRIMGFGIKHKEELQRINIEIMKEAARGFDTWMYKDNNNDTGKINNEIDQVLKFLGYQTYRNKIPVVGENGKEIRKHYIDFIYWGNKELNGEGEEI